MAEVIERRQVKMHLSLQLLASLIDLPEDVRVVRLIPRQDPDGIALILESDRFEPVLPDCESPYVNGLQEWTATDDESGKRFVRLALEV